MPARHRFGVPPRALWPRTTALRKLDEWLHETPASVLYRRREELADEVSGKRAGPGSAQAS